MASETSKYSAYLHGLQVDLDDFRSQTDEIGRYVTEHAPEAAGRLSFAGLLHGRGPAPLTSNVRGAAGWWTSARRPRPLLSQNAR